VDEIVIVDMTESSSIERVVKDFEAKTFKHKRSDYVELVRNFGNLRAKGQWILILDPDEEISPSLVKSLRKITNKPVADYYRVPRKNIIFGKWMQHTRWWPDYNIRFFKKGYVSWSEEIHGVPVTQGRGADLPKRQELAIIHHNYDSVTDYLERMIRYTRVQAETLLKNGYVFRWQDLIKKPIDEFLSRYFEGEGYRDGIHGLALSFLQSFSEAVIYLKIWEKQGFSEKELSRRDLLSEFGKATKEFKWWLRKKLTLFGKFF
jgi:(heptosyl)LPS beta-1,4-glucosyltransferase